MNETGTVPGAADPDHGEPVGRERERMLLHGLLDSLPDRGAALLLRGEPGIGKSTLLDDAAARAATGCGTRVLRARGVESEAVLPYTVLADLLLPLRAFFKEVPPAQCRALEGCLALADVAAPNPYAVCAGALGVFAAAGEKEPLVVLVDDLHWADPSSRRVLHFVARRLATERVALVMAVRAEDGDVAPWEGVPQLELAPLSGAACRELLRRHGLDPATPAAARLIPLSMGNPLVLVEYADAQARLRTDAGDPTRPDWETPGPLVERAWWGRMRALAPESREALLYVAVCNVPEYGLLERALDAAGLSLGALTAAEEAGLVRAGPQGYELRHPVLRPLVLAHGPAPLRLRAYRVLADLSSGELRTWYRASAVSGPDESVAGALAESAERARRHGALAASARAWHRAAELSPAARDRAVRYLNAAEDAFHSGGTTDAAQWCEEALRHSTDPALTAAVELLRGQARSWLGDPGGAHRLLMEAGAAAGTAAPTWACALYGAAVMPAAMSGRIRRAAETADRCAALASALGTGPELRLGRVLRANTLALSGQVRRARPLLRAAHAAMRGDWPVQDGQLAVLIGQALSWVDDEEASRAVLDAVIDRARRDGLPALLPFALVERTETESWGRWAAARADATEALRWGQEFGHTAMTGYALTSLARLEGLRGERAACEEHIASFERHCGEGVPGLEVFAQSALGSAALTAGDPDPCRGHLERAFAAADRMGLANPNLMPFVADLAEAHHRTGSRDRAVQLTHWLDERARATGLAWPTAAHARCRAFLAGDADDVMRWLACAERAHTRRSMPYELARTRLVCGQALRRLRRPAAAREPLQAAHRGFTALGAATWAARAAAELAAAGHPSASPSERPPPVDLLTAQELQVARAIGSGLSNVEAATALFISRKTVEAHLTRVYRKLGLRSRSELARCLARTGDVD
ncbi:helix-turn-helix transcriptional regulator [Streptomyces sp. BYX5S]